MAAEKVAEATKKRPTITLPPRPSVESLYGSGFSPGPMTLVSNFFADESNYQSFTQLLAGAMASPLAKTPSFLGNKTNGSDGSNGNDDVKKDGEEKKSFSGFRENRPMSLAIAKSPLFTIPPGLSPSGLLSSPGFFSPQSPFGMSHQQALAHVTAQAALNNQSSNMHGQAEYQQPSSISALSEPSMNLDESSQQQSPSSTSNPTLVIEPSEISHSDGKNLNPSLAADKHSDGYNWRKYGQKPIKGSVYPRSYYKCTHLNCPVKKKVERSSDGLIAQIIYKNQHNHEKPQPGKRGKEGSGDVTSQTKSDVISLGPGGNHPSKLNTTAQNHSDPGSNQESNQAAVIHLHDSSDSEELVGQDRKREGDNTNDGLNPKRRNVAGETEVTLSQKTVTEPKIIVQTRSEVDLLDDGYRWRKYGQKVVKGNPHPRSYYKCTYSGCNVRKHVERAPNDPKAVITTYEGKHNHDVPASRHSSHNSANNNATHVKPIKVVTKKHPVLKDMDFGNNDKRPVLLRLKEEQLIV